jgi:hypothetical protein
VREDSVRDAFDTLVATAIAQPDYTVSPSWHGDIRQFNYEDAGSAERPFAFIVNRGHLLFYVRQPGLRRIAGGFPGLKDQFDSAQENSRGEWTVRIASREDAERLDAFLFRPSAPDQSGIPDGSRRDGPEAAATTDKPWRTNPQAAGELLDAVLSGVAPDTHRLCVEALIHSIAFAKDHFPDSWVVTLNPDHVRFIVGMVMCLQLRKDGGGSILLLKRVTPPKLRKNGGEYRYAPGCVEVSLTLEELAEQYSPLMEAHEAAILACAQAHAGSGGHRQAHSPGLVAYLTGQAEAGDATSLVNTAGDHDQDPDAYADRAVFSRIDLGPTEKQTLVNARRGSIICGRAISSLGKTRAIRRSWTATTDCCWRRILITSLIRGSSASPISGI